MSMLCYQCQETAAGQGCTVQGVCGKTETVANTQDLLIYVLKGLAVYGMQAEELDLDTEEVDEFIMESLFTTITNANFSEEDIITRVKEGLSKKEALKDRIAAVDQEAVTDLSEVATWQPANEEEIYNKAEEVGVKTTENEDINSLRELLIYGVKGMAAYADHAYVLGEKKDDIFSFMKKALAATTDDSLSVDDLVGLVLECGEVGVDTMALLDQANTAAYGNPEPTEVELGVRDNPAILVSGHDLKDLEELLDQTEGTGVDVYTHGEMLPAHSYPAFKKYDHFVGNYGGSWWRQKEEFEKFNGPILMTTNCIVPPKDSYKDRIYTTGVVGFAGIDHIPDRKEGVAKDFSTIIEDAKKCDAPEELESGSVMGGFAHQAVSEVADKVVEAVKAGDISRFFVMGGCDGRHTDRDYYTEFAKSLPEDTVILTAGCAKYRYNKLDLGDIGGIPRVLDAGQCNDSYSLVVIAQKLAAAFDVDDINELPISYNIAWYEQKAVLVLLALLSLGVKNIHLGPSLPAFVSENVLDVLVEEFNIKPNTTVEEDLETMMTEE
ncbi:hydroxylamine reductase [Halanaerobaculum tunisiense]